MTTSTFKIGDDIRVTVSHLAGMRGTVVKVEDDANRGALYDVQMRTGELHRWVQARNVEAPSAAVPLADAHAAYAAAWRAHAAATRALEAAKAGLVEAMSLTEAVNRHQPGDIVPTADGELKFSHSRLQPGVKQATVVLCFHGKTANGKKWRERADVTETIIVQQETGE